MKRSAELIPLSHDHHQALFVAQRLRRAEDAEEATGELLAFWVDQGADHFRAEEELLLPAWLANDAGADRELAARLAAEHLDLRSRIRAIEHGERTIEALAEVGKRLAAHVRFEERQLFGVIEAALDDQQLADLGAELAAAEKRTDQR